MPISNSLSKDWRQSSVQHISGESWNMLKEPTSYPFVSQRKVFFTIDQNFDFKISREYQKISHAYESVDVWRIFWVMLHRSTERSTPRLKGLLRIWVQELVTGFSSAEDKRFLRSTIGDFSVLQSVISLPFLDGSFFFFPEPTFSSCPDWCTLERCTGWPPTSCLPPTRWSFESPSIGTTSNLPL